MNTIFWLAVTGCVLSGGLIVLLLVSVWGIKKYGIKYNDDKYILENRVYNVKMMQLPVKAYIVFIVCLVVALTI